MGWSTNTATEVKLWERQGLGLKAYHLAISGTSIPTGTEEREIDLATLAPDIVSAGYGWLWVCDWAAASGAVSATPVLGTVTAPASALNPYVISFTAGLRDGIGPAVAPRWFKVDSGTNKLFLRPSLNTIGDFRMDLVISQFRGGGS